MNILRKLVLLILLGTVGINAQDKDTMIVSPELERYTFQFMVEGYMRDMNLTDILFKNVDTIKVDTMLFFPEMGYFHKYKRTVGVSYQIFIDSLAVKATLFHELAHAVSNNMMHSDRKGDLMYYRTPKSFYRYGDKKVWDRKLDSLYIWIKNE
jgi:hypothetical protein